MPAILQSGRAVGKSTEALRFHRSEPAKYLALGGRRPRLAPTRARADDGPGHDRDGPGRRRSRRPLRRAAARTAPAFSGGVTDFTALDVLEWTTRRRRIAPVHSPLAISLVSTIAQILLVQTPQVGYKFADGGPAAARVGSSVGAGRYRYHWPSLIRCPIRKTTRLLTFCEQLS